jgi:hypothetical protein
VRFVLAIVSFVAAALLIGLGIAQRTVFAEPDTVTAATNITSSAPVTVLSGSALNAFPRNQSVELSGADENFSAYGRTDDVVAWVGDASYNNVTYDAKTRSLVSTLVKGDADEVPSPVDSDLWLASYANEGSFTINVPEDISLLIVTDGVKPAPADLSVTWPVDNSTPWANTLVVAGGVLLLIGLLLLLWAIAHIRRSRGPRRKSPQKMPKLPRQPRIKQITSKRRELESNAKGRRSARIAIVPAVLVTALALGGCSSDALTGGTPATEASPSATAADAVAKAALEVNPVITERQAERIIKKVSEVSAAADAALDPELAKTRLSGPALELRAANYAARKVDPAVRPVDVIPAGPVTLTLPQQSDSWPRVAFAVIDDATKDAAGNKLAPVSVMLVQADPRSNYTAQYVMRLQPGAVVPPTAPASIGASRLFEDSKLLTIAPDVIAPDYADILMNDTASPSNELFEAEGDSVRVNYGAADKAARKAPFVGTSTLEFSNAPASGPVVALSTIDSGAIVTVNVNEVETVRILQAGAVAKATPEVKAITGKAESTKGLSATYGYQMLFFVPSVEEGGKIVLLGYTRGLVAASELP